MTKKIGSSIKEQQTVPQIRHSRNLYEIDRRLAETKYKLSKKNHAITGPDIKDHHTKAYSPWKTQKKLRIHSKNKKVKKIDITQNLYEIDRRLVEKKHQLPK